MDSNYSLSDIRAVTDGGMDGFGSGSWLWIIVLLILLGGGRGFGFGANASDAYVTTSQYEAENNFRTLDNKMNAIGDGICSATYDLNNTILTEGRALQTQIADCCCNTQLGLANLAAQGDKNTCAITTAVHDEAEKTRALIQQNEIQALRDKVADLQMAQSQCAQNAYLINTLRPYPAPAYAVANPYCATPCATTCCNV